MIIGANKENEPDHSLDDAGDLDQSLLIDSEETEEEVEFQVVHDICSFFSNNMYYNTVSEFV
ncbi:unnamed protein product [Protopolystoma xenopodis]|uniref:Uncharacterized protein n=1 Tax=Protopolystoma xenopodis TaxID=117903 RepID=A0A3S5AYQ0_9PLAT|nr:unnamed protein product [Protopolystoma xenopodis]